MNDNVFTRRLNLPLETTPRRLKAVRFLRVHGPMLVGALVLLAAMGSLTVVLFVRSSNALQAQMRETLRSTAVAAALSVDGDQLGSIRDAGDIGTPEYLRVSSMLRHVVEDVPQVRFAYVLRRTTDPDVLQFVADADSEKSPEELDANGNGEVDPDEEPSFPGELYDVSEIPALQDEAFRRATTDEEPTYDQWGVLLSGYAPIRSRSTGDVVAVLGVDMDAAEFYAKTTTILSPFAVVAILALTAMLAASVALLIESRQLSALARVNAERSGLLQLTFHQLGEPITILQWGIETLEDSKDDIDALRKSLPENLEDMREGVRRLGSIIDTLQEAEKVELGAFENKPVRQSLKEYMESAASLVVPTAVGDASRVALEVEDAECDFDPHLMTVALRRLVENALEFSPEESIVRLSASCDDAWVHITVADRGCGIPKEDLPRLFEKYRRASNASLMKPDGNGLGLYIVRGAVYMMGGDVRVDSAVDEGTTVALRVPRHTSKHA